MFILEILFVLPFCILIHELGHAVAVKLLGGNIQYITLGKGEELLVLGKLRIRSLWFWGGSCFYESSKELSRLSRVIIHLGGVTANLLTIIVIAILAVYVKEYSFYEDIFKYSLLMLFCLIPYRFEGHNSDGMQIYQLLRYGQSTYEVDK